MVTISCSGKFHAFALAEQLERKGKLGALYTTYAFQKNSILRKVVKRIDKENIPAAKIHTNTLLAFPIKLLPQDAFRWNDYFDKWVAASLKKEKSRVFIGWSGMSLHSIKVAKKMGMQTILERGSSHIVYQDEILREEYKKFGKAFSIDKRVIEKELLEYDLADYISVPSHFVRNSFIEKGVPEQKLIMNPYGASTAFQQAISGSARDKQKFTIVYMGTLNIRKGLLYFFQALDKLEIPEANYNVWFLGSIDPSIQPSIERYKKDNWTFFGHINHYELKDYLAKCHVGIQPSLEEGLSMVIPQMMASGITMIISPNSGGENIITDKVNGYVVPIRNPQAIKEKIEMLYADRPLLAEISKKAADAIQQGFTWDDYGNRYMTNLEKVANG